MSAENPYNVEPEWEVLTYDDTDGMFSSLELDWEVKILVGNLRGSEKFNADLRELIMKQEERLVKHTEADSDGDTMLDETHLTSRFKNWNVHYLDHPAAEVLWDYVQDGMRHFFDLHNIQIPQGMPLSMQSWGNVLRDGEEISEHTHVAQPSQCVVTTNYCVTADQSTSTVYNLPGYKNRKASITNEPGQLVVFPPWLPHYTTEFTNMETERITIASDINVEEWKQASFDSQHGERLSHWLPFNESPRRKKKNAPADVDWGDIPGVDGTIARLVNYNGELTEDLVREMKNKGTDFAQRKLTVGDEPSDGPVLPEQEANFNTMPNRSTDD